jgi:hypothetical protein
MRYTSPIEPLQLAWVGPKTNHRDEICFELRVLEIGTGEASGPWRKMLARQFDREAGHEARLVAGRLGRRIRTTEMSMSSNLDTEK